MRRDLSLRQYKAEIITVTQEPRNQAHAWFKKEKLLLLTTSGKHSYLFTAYPTSSTKSLHCFTCFKRQDRSVRYMNYFGQLHIIACMHGFSFEIIIC